MLFLICGLLAGAAACSEDDDKACTPGQTKCEGHAVVTCGSDGAWGAANACSPSMPVCITAAGRSQCAACAPGQTKCEGDSVVTCGAGGSWGAPAACADPTPICMVQSDGTASCSLGTTIAGCVPGETECIGSSLKTCGTDEKWGAAVACADPTPVCGKDASGKDACIAEAECTAGEKKCEGSRLVTCGADGKWGAAAACADPTPVCGKDASGKPACVAKPADACTAGQTKCGENDNIFTCGPDGSWDEGRRCIDETPYCGLDKNGKAACLGKSEIACEPGETKCEGTSVMTCDENRQWVETKCEDPTPVCYRKDKKSSCVERKTIKTCPKIMNGKTQCFQSTIMKCVEGNWHIETTCGGDRPVCASDENDEAACVAAPDSNARVCSHNETRCSKDLSKVMKCTIDGIWDSGEICSAKSPQCRVLESGEAVCGRLPE